MATSMQQVNIEAIDVTAIEAPSMTHSDAAQYVEEMCSELAQLADRTGLGFLAYLLEVAREEASIHNQDTGMRTRHGELPNI